MREAIRIQESTASFRLVILCNRNVPGCIAAWHADVEVLPCPLLLSSDGTAVVTKGHGQVCILKLYHGNRRIMLEGAEALLSSVGRIQNEQG